MRQRSLPGGESERGFGHAIAFVLVVLLVVLVVALVATLRKHDPSIDAAAVARSVGPSVVAVNNAGSGVAISPREIVTAAHLVDAPGAEPIVSNNAGWRATATVAGYDRAADIAVLQLPANVTALPSAAVGDSATLRTHNAVVVVSETGPTRGTVRSETTGAVTIAAPVRDTAVGGPVVDANHDVVALVRHLNGAATVDALPWNAVVSIVNTIDAGVSTATVHVGPAASLGVTVAPVTGSAGVRVTAVQPGGAAAVAGVTTGEVIASVRSVPVSSQADIDAALDPVGPGAVLPVAVFDANGMLHTVSVRLGAA